MCILRTLPADANKPTDVGLSTVLRNPYAVRRWLEAKRPDEIVGMAGDASGCTLHTYMYEKTGQRASVRDRQYTFGIYGGDGSYQMPAWATRFIVYHDRGRGKHPVTAAKALRALAMALDPDAKTGRRVQYPMAKEKAYA